ncbi:hypothetical protein K440DRAFT_665972 [Wilcoxina mikolae CBS 423.85]|nr:hypothetical protein K440DRAFT_665972 [Wilcoxina mikolae CBS 423.85]
MKHITFVLTLAFFIAITLATDDFSESAYQKALEHGVDPDGPYPTDFTENTGKRITFSAGSKFSLWAAARHSRKVKRASSGSFDMTMWSTNTCGGASTFIPDVQFNQIYGGVQEYNSLQLTGSVAPHTVALTLGQGNECGTDQSHLSYANDPGCRENLATFTCVVVLER